MNETDIRQTILGNLFAAERERWVLWLPVFLGVGIGGYFALPVEPAGWLGPAVLGMIVIFAVLFRERIGARLIFFALVAVALGFCVAQFRTDDVAAPVLEKRLRSATVEGRVIFVEPNGKGRRILLDEIHISRIAPERTPEKARIRISARGPELRPGDRIQVRAGLSAPPPPVAPGAFDFQRQSFFRGLGAVGFAYGPPKVIASSEEPDFLLFLADARLAIGERVMAGLGGVDGTLARALMTGERGAIPQKVLAAMRDSGMAHLLAISGLHIGLVAGILFVGIRAGLALIPQVALRYPIKKVAAALGIVGALAYALIAGATIPTQRAFLMVGLVLLAVVLDRRGLSIRTVAWAALLILLIQPESLLGASFQLSFAAVTGLIAFYERFRDIGRGTGGGAYTWNRRLLFYLGGVALSTLVAGSVTGPFAVYHFNRFAVFGLAANLGAVPLTALWIMPWAVVAFILMPLGLEGLALVPMGWGIGAVIHIAETVAAWPGAVTLLPAMPVWGLVSVALGGLWLALWRQSWRYFGVVPIALGLATLWFPDTPDILIDDRGELLAARMGDGKLAVSTLRKGRFDREIWLRRSGQANGAKSWPREGESPDGRLACDTLGCIYRVDGMVVALVRGEGALSEDCRNADALVSSVPVSDNCPSAGVVIDRFDLWREGAHAMWLDDGNFRVQSVNGSRGDRPWVLRPKSASN
ncbi:MAG: ComEC family competence protein [Rhodospirillales bacterium]|jgi:competence protein ComEC|nr:ComEC family competence protein [Rhodospirillales bacterium]